MGAEQMVNYRLARSVVMLDGGVTIDTADDGTDSYTRTCQVTIGCAADPGADLKVEIDDKLGAERKFDIKLADDGRLTGANDSSTGLGAQIIGDVVTLATAAAAVVAPRLLAEPRAVRDLLTADSAAPPTGPTSIEHQYAAARPEVAQTRAKLAAAASALDDALATASETAAGEDEISDARKNQLTELSAAVTAVRAELTVAETDFQTWKTATFAPRKVSITRAIGVDELCSISETPETRTFSATELSGQEQTAYTLGVVVAVVETTRPGVQTPEASDATFIYRIPRLVQIAVYVRAREDGFQVDLDGALQLSQVSSAWIIDNRSELGEVHLTHGVFKDRSTTVAFSDAGVLNELGNHETPPLAAISKALGAAGGQITNTLGTVSKVSTAFAQTDPKLAALNAQVSEQELRARLVTANATIAKASTGAATGS
jgi:hypothetical protein